MRTYLEAMTVQHRIAHGFIAGFARYVDARLECMTTALGASERDMAQQERLVFDGRRDQERDKLRRLYPMTIIGPDIWAQLPPMPAFDPMPTIEDLGTCKLLTAWPTLCPPRDPAFLRGTRALREWLWPYTIQNPADHVDKDPAG
ncbi:MAG: hypothetical protein IPL61_06860 [Myxococcales bacterium]|nr:hypothetical protein [Myxococcales bacterium]